jgi:hypothetical protein
MVSIGIWRHHCRHMAAVKPQPAVASTRVQRLAKVKGKV